MLSAGVVGMITILGCFKFLMLRILPRASRHSKYALTGELAVISNVNITYFNWRATVFLGISQNQCQLRTSIQYKLESLIVSFPQIYS